MRKIKLEGVGEREVTTCANCGIEGVVCATPAGECVAPGAGLLVSVAERLALEGLEILAASSHALGEAVCETCEDIRDREALAADEDEEER